LAGVSLGRMVAESKPSEDGPSASRAPRGQAMSRLPNGRRGSWRVTWSVQQREGARTWVQIANPGLEHSIGVLMGEDVPGVVQRDRRQPVQTITIRTSPAQDEAMQRIITEALGRPRPYNLFSRNCAIFVEEVLRAGSLQVPNTNLPGVLIRQLQQTYGERRGVPSRGDVR